ncbi:RHS repeat-associated core domain-containing protein [Streptomyces sp. NBC_00233]|uniref:RHS repeat-associated core domain-containing protein n=1 Tax=Streptomyces sp. NBC_00233 TaxID=2975686 RepID=UPI002258C11D|nr:RHS repeat-associated core domain-containing protein [Streptomyces sp. NBC_00233]MCX5231441.1 toxin glutamine deamidase domain-containing protein [Streptomyces sp. NBC_00233]MCX5233005.1 toxin glutamine deamidase domain-containing protein [Streptomyces sp. NBC_00233]
MSGRSIKPHPRLGVTAAAAIFSLLLAGVPVFSGGAFAAVAEADPNVAPAMPAGASLPIPAAPISGAGATAVGTLPGSGNVEPSGAYTYSIPLQVPAGRTGMQPQLALTYSSLSDEGMAGKGWALAGLSRITRCAQSIASEGQQAGVKYDGSDRFCLDGEKLVVVGSTDAAAESIPAYGDLKAQYRTETDTSAMITVSGGSSADGPDSFTVKSKNGQILRFDAVTAPQFTQSATKTDTGVWSDRQSRVTRKVAWLLASVKDRSNNEIKYTYDQPEPDAATFNPKRITYTHGNGQDAYRSVDFTYEFDDLSSTGIGYQAGVTYYRNTRLTQISMSAPNPATTETVWKYTLGYGAPSNSGHNMLRTVTMCGAKGGCLRTKELTYGDPAAEPTFAANPIGGKIASNRVPQGMKVADFNGDGLQDALVVQRTSADNSTLPTWSVKLGTYQGTVAQPLAHSVNLDDTGWPRGAKMNMIRPIDLTGDGSSELVASFDDNEGGLISTLYRWDAVNEKFVEVGDRWDAPSNEFGDLNGDGLIDHIMAGIDLPGTEDVGYGVRLNDGTADPYTHSQVLTPPPGKQFPFRPGCEARVADLDGDGKAELYANTVGGPTPSGDCETSGTETHKPSKLGVENNQVTTTEYSQEADGKLYYSAPPFLREYQTVLSDITGDGLQDIWLIPRSKNSTLTPVLLVNEGTGLYVGQTNSAAWNGRYLLPGADVNSDGFDDTLYVGDGGELKLSLTGGATSDITVSDHGLKSNQGPLLMPQLGDFDADGQVDIARMIPDPADQSANPAWILETITQTPEPGRDRLVSIQDAGITSPNQGERVHYSFSWSDHPEKNTSYTCAYPVACQRHGLAVVRQVSSRSHLVDIDPVTSPKPVSVFYSYEDPAFDMRGRGGLGFGTFRIWDPQRPQETTYTYPHRDRTADGNYYPGASSPGEIFTVTPILTQAEVASGVKDNVKTRVSKTTIKHTTKKTNSGRTYVTDSKDTVTREWEQTASFSYTTPLGTTQTAHVTGITQPLTPDMRTYSEQVSYDDYGNETDGTTGDSLNAPVAFSATWGTEYDNRTDVNTWLIGLPTKSTVTSIRSGQSVTRTSETHYDSAGRPDQLYLEKDNPDTSLRQLTTLRYDSNGLQTAVIVDDDQTVDESTETGLPQRESRTEYGTAFPNQPDEHVYPSQTWAKHTPTDQRPSVWTATHPAYGVTVATLDINKLTSSATYDDLGRITQAKQTGAADIDYSYANRADKFVGPKGGVTTTTSGGITSKATTDGLGRSISSTVTGFDGTTSTASQVYDVLGRTVSTTAPAPQGTTTVDFDSLDQPVKTTLPDGKFATNAYTFDPVKSVTTSTDPNGYRHKNTTNILGQLTASTDVLRKPDGSDQDISTTFTYRPFGLPATATDTKGNVTTSIYDVRGRRTQLTDPDRGQSSTTYYGTGETKTDTGAKLTSTGYDDLGRQTTSVNSTDGTTSFTYDTATNGIGMAATATSPDGIKTTYRYDTASRPAGIDITDTGNGNRKYSTDQTYDSIGRPDSLSYPDPDGTGGAPRFTIKSHYNNFGYQDKITDITLGRTASDLWTVSSRKANLALDTAILGNGANKITVKNTYDTGTGRLHGITATGANNTRLQDLTYTYKANGLLDTREQNDTTTGSVKRTEAFGYDTLSRLTSWDLTNGTSPKTTTSYTYNEIGNLTKIANPSQGLDQGHSYGTLSGSQPHTLTDNGAYVYDPRGRQTSGGGRTNVSYTSFDLPKTITTGGKTTTYRYDAFGQRAKETNATTGTTTFYVPGLYQERTKGASVQHLYTVTGPDGPVAQVTHDGATTTLYQLSDQLGSTTTAVDTANTVKQTNFFDPFGARINAAGTPAGGALAGPVDRGFTGHEDDSEFGLINMKGRVYDPAIKRFLTPDPLVSDPTDTQSWNHYSYVRNSPLNRTDPTGYEDCEVSGAQVENGTTKANEACSRQDNNLFGGLVGSDGIIHNNIKDGQAQISGTEVKPPAARSDGLGTGYNTDDFNTPIPFNTMHDYFIARVLELDAAKAQENTAPSGIWGAIANFFAGLEQAIAGKTINERAVIAAENEALSNSPSARMEIGLSAGIALIPLAAGDPFAPSPVAVPTPSPRGGLSLGATGNPGSGSVINGVQINPKRGVINCVGCTIAADATQAGRAAQALGNRLGAGSMGDLASYAASTGHTQKGGAASPRQLAAIARIWGPGSQGVIGATGGNAPNHAFNVRNDDGIIRFSDSQNGGVPNLKDWSAFQIYRTK